MIRPRLLILIVSLLAGAQLARGDTLTGELRGQVIDVETGVPLNAARMVLTSVDRGWSREQVTDAEGRYAFLQLSPGNYSLRAETGGYYALDRTDILIRLNRLRVLLPPFELRRLVSVPTREITLQSELAKRAVIDLSAAGPTPVIIAVTEETGPELLITLGDAAVRFNFGVDLLAALPLRGSRSFDQLALLAPGVAPAPFSGGRGPAVGLGVGLPGQFSVNGLRGRSNTYTIDGSDTQDEDIGVRRQGFLAETPQPADSIQDFQIVTAGPPAELGRSAGAWVNAVSRAGTSRTHGTVSGLFSHHFLRRRSPLDRPFSDQVNSGRLHGGDASREEIREAQGSGTVGGQLGAGWFYLGSLQGRSESSRRIGHFVVPTVEERGLRTRIGTIPISQLDNFLSARGTGYRGDAGAAVYSLIPLPNNPSGPFGKHNYSQVRRERGDAAIGSMRLDWQPGTPWSFTSRYNFTRDDLLLPFTGTAINSSLPTATRTRNLSLHATRTGPQWAQSLRASWGWTRLRFPADLGDELLFGSPHRPEAAGTPAIRTPYGDFGPFGATGPLGQLQVLPYSPVGIDVFNFPQGRTNNSGQVAGIWTRWTGSHQFRAGFELRFTGMDSFNDRNSRPLVVFAPGYVSGACMLNPQCVFATPDGLLSGTDAAALGAPAGVLQTLSSQSLPDSRISLTFNRWEWFVQDEWQPIPNLSLSAGIRYELQTVPREASRRLERTFGVSAGDFPRLVPSTPGACTGDSPATGWDSVICSGNLAFDRAVDAWNRSLGGRDRIYRGSRGHLSPRLGFAWDPRGTGRTVVRGGFWHIREAQLGAVTSQSRNVFPTFIPLNLDLNFQPPDGRFLNNPAFFRFGPTGTPLISAGSLNRYAVEEAFATGLGSLFIQAPPFPGAPLSSNGLAFTLPSRDLPASYAEHVSLGLEQALGSRHAIALRYVGTRGRQLTRFETPNAGLIATPVLFSSPLLGLSLLSLPPHPIAAGQGRPDPDLGAYNVFANSARSEYHSLQASLHRRFQHGLQFHFNWTWSHALDEVSDPFETRGAPALPQQSSRPDLEWGDAGFDLRHRVAGYLMWRPEEDSFARNWSVGLGLQAHSGQPYTVTSALDRNSDGNLADRPDSTQGIRQGPDGSLRIEAGTVPQDLLAPRGQSGRVGRNTFRGDSLLEIDLAVTRNFRLRGSGNVELRWEIFNLLNNRSYGIPVRILESPGFGRPFDLQADPRATRIMLRLSY